MLSSAMSEATAPVVRLARVAKHFGAVPVLQDISVELPQGTSTGLVGVNGAGKTTLIKCLLDFCSIDAGQIELFGLPHNRPESRRQLAFVPERFVPPYFLSGRQFVRAMLGIAQRPYREAEVRAMFGDLDLDQSVLDRPVRALSKGMTQKLGLAACLLSERRFYVLDEPMSGLDPKARARVKAMLRQLKSGGKTLLLTSHSLADIEEICDHMLVLDRGRIAFAGAPDEFQARFGEPTLERAFLRCIEGVHG
jgi:ABC-2 type transport system ATP-binding protein